MGYCRRGGGGAGLGSLVRQSQTDLAIHRASVYLLDVSFKHPGGIATELSQAEEIICQLSGAQTGDSGLAGTPGETSLATFVAGTTLQRAQRPGVASLPRLIAAYHCLEPLRLHRRTPRAVRPLPSSAEPGNLLSRISSDHRKSSRRWQLQYLAVTSEEVRKAAA